MRSLTFDEAMNKIHDDEINLHIYHECRQYYSDKPKWEVRLYKSKLGVSVDVEAKNEDFFTAFYEAWDTYQRVLGNGAPELVPAQLEHIRDSIENA